METKKILSIEDDAFLSGLISDKFVENGFAIITANLGGIGIQEARTQKPALILLDLMLPDMSGFDILKEIKEDSDTKDIPVVILSNLGGSGDLEKGLALGAERYLIKSNVLPEEVVEIVQEILSKK